MVGWARKQHHHHAASIDVWEGSKNENRERERKERRAYRVLLCVVLDPIHFSQPGPFVREYVFCVLVMSGE